MVAEWDDPVGREAEVLATGSDEAWDADSLFDFVGAGVGADGGAEDVRRDAVLA